MHFVTYLAQANSEISEELTSYLHQLEKTVEEEFPSLISYISLFTESTLGGKVLRGTLVKLSYEFFSKERIKKKHFIDSAVAFEIMHASLLIHDDIMDKSRVRRGKPSVYFSLHKDHFGLSKAICLGDLGFFLAYKRISESSIAPEIAVKITYLFSRILSETVLGQMLDMELSYHEEKKEEEIFTLYSYKTARYSFVGPLLIGAFLAHASKETTETLKKFGEALGIAFQIQDDILGVFGDQQLLGKSTSSDIAEGKNTILLAYALKHSTAMQNSGKRLYGKGEITPEVHESIKHIFIQSGALAYAQKQMRLYGEQAKSLIPQITQEQVQQELLYSLVDFLMSRKK